MVEVLKEWPRYSASRQWGSGSENEAKGADWKALWLRLSQEPTQVLARKGSDLIYEQ
jgi:hypothetical protein